MCLCSASAPAIGNTKPDGAPPSKAGRRSPGRSKIPLESRRPQYTVQPFPASKVPGRALIRPPRRSARPVRGPGGSEKTWAGAGASACTQRLARQKISPPDSYRGQAVYNQPIAPARITSPPARKLAPARSRRRHRRQGPQRQRAPEREPLPQISRRSQRVPRRSSSSLPWPRLRRYARQQAGGADAGEAGGAGNGGTVMQPTSLVNCPRSRSAQNTGASASGGFFSEAVAGLRGVFRRVSLISGRATFVPLRELPGLIRSLSRPLSGNGLLRRRLLGCPLLFGRRLARRLAPVSPGATSSDIGSARATNSMRATSALQSSDVPGRRRGARRHGAPPRRDDGNSDPRKPSRGNDQNEGTKAAPNTHQLPECTPRIGHTGMVARTSGGACQAGARQRPYMPQQALVDPPGGLIARSTSVFVRMPDILGVPTAASILRGHTTAPLRSLAIYLDRKPIDLRWACKLAVKPTRLAKLSALSTSAE